MGFSAVEQAQTASAKGVIAGLTMVFLVFSLAGCGGPPPTAKVVSQTISGQLSATVTGALPLSGTISFAMDADSGAFSFELQQTMTDIEGGSLHVDVRRLYDPTDRKLTEFKKITETVAGNPPTKKLECFWYAVQPGLAIDQAALGLLTSQLRAISASTPNSLLPLHSVPCDKSPMDCLRDLYANMPYKGADGDNSVFNFDKHSTAPFPGIDSIKIHEEFTLDPANLLRKVALSVVTSVPVKDKPDIVVTAKTDMTMDSAKGGKPDAGSFDAPPGFESQACEPAPEATATAHKTTVVTQQKAIVV